MDKLNFDNDLSQEEKFRYNYFRGSYYYKMGNYNKSLEYFHGGFEIEK